MKVRLGRLILLATAAAVVSPGLAASPKEKAAELREQYVKNFSKIRTISFVQRTSTKKPSAVMRAAPQAQERVVWNREKKKLKWTHSTRQDAYVVDGFARKLSIPTVSGAHVLQLTRGMGLLGTSG